MYHIIICDDENTFIQYIQSVILKCDICEEEVIFHKYNSEDMLMHDINMIPRCDLVILNVKDMADRKQETAFCFRKHFPDAILVYCSEGCQPTDELFKTMPFRYRGYHAVYIPTEDYESVKEYLRMRNDHKLTL